MGYGNLLIILAICLGCASCSRSQDRRACEADVQRLCSNGSAPKAGNRTVLNCLLEHKAELSQACRRNVESHAPRAAAAR